MVLSKSVLVVWFVVIAAQAAGAQQSPMPAEIAAKLQELGRVIDPPQTSQVYAPLQEKEPYQDVKVERDAKYGAADRNLLDIFMPAAAASSPRPVLIFVHGGGFARGNKRAPGTPFNDNIMLWAVRNGYIGVNTTYRLAPQAVWPAGAEDVAAAVQWVSDQIGARGGDPAHVYLMGHSTGAVHVADYVSRPELHKAKGGGLAGAILISGVYDMPASVLDYRVYYGADPARYAEQSSLPGLLTTRIPLMMVAAELDPTRFVEQFDLLKQASCARASGCMRAVMLPQHSHMSEVYSINTADARLTSEIVNFTKTGK
jgi:acetyl esterase/lipase